MKLLFYGRLADLIGRELELEAGERCTISELRRRLIDEHEQAGEALGRTGVRACVGEKLVGDDYQVGTDDTVEFLPPVSGG